MPRGLALASVAVAAAAGAVAVAAWSAATRPAALRLPPANRGFDYQLGGADPPPPGVALVARDRTEVPADVYSICYINGFQTQPGAADWWLAEHPNLVLRTAAGDPVIDPDWPDEMLLDITTAGKRRQLAAIVGAWIDGCATRGFDAVEVDNIDTYARAGGQIGLDDAVATVRLLSDRAHAAGLPVGQKNASELLGYRTATGLDFAVVEECNRYDECDDYIKAYEDQVYVVEYRRADFDHGCAAYPQLSIVLRDRGLVPVGAGGHVRQAC
jgi:hypothetical protein